MKYVVFECKNESKPTFYFGITFPDDLVHKDVAEMIEHIKVCPEGPYAGWWVRPKAIRAGFIDRAGNPFGMSESLKMRSSPDDKEILNLPSPVKSGDPRVMLVHRHLGEPFNFDRTLSKVILSPFGTPDEVMIKAFDKHKTEFCEKFVEFKRADWTFEFVADVAVLK